VMLWDVETGALKKTLNGHESDVYSVAFSPGGKTVASAGLNANEVRLWDAETGAPKQTLKGEYAYAVYAIAFSPDGAILAGAGADKTVKLWE